MAERDPASRCCGAFPALGPAAPCSAGFAPVVALAALIASSAPVSAQSPDLLSLGGGAYDTSRNTPRDRATDFRLEYRPVAVAWRDEGIVLRPFAGVEVTTDGAVYGLGGLSLDLAIGALVMTPSFGAGLYHDGGGKELGSVVEFRSTFEIGWRIKGGGRISLGYGHISNAGITDRNPGTEIVTLYWHQPVDW